MQTNQLSPYSTEKFTATEGLQKQVSEMIPEFHIESRKLLVELFRLDQLDIKFFESYCKKNTLTTES